MMVAVSTWVSPTGVNHAGGSRRDTEWERTEMRRAGVKLHYSEVVNRGRSPAVSDNTTTVHITCERVTNLSIQPLTPELQSVRQQKIRQSRSKKGKMEEWKQM